MKAFCHSLRVNLFNIVYEPFFTRWWKRSNSLVSKPLIYQHSPDLYKQIFQEIKIGYRFLAKNHNFSQIVFQYLKTSEKLLLYWKRIGANIAKNLRGSDYYWIIELSLFFLKSWSLLDMDHLMTTDEFVREYCYNELFEELVSKLDVCVYSYK